MQATTSQPSAAPDSSAPGTTQQPAPAPQRGWDKLDSVDRARVQMALIALLLVMAALVVIIRMGGRFTRRLGREIPLEKSRPTGPRPFLKPLSDEEVQAITKLGPRSDGDDTRNGTGG